MTVRASKASVRPRNDEEEEKEKEKDEEQEKWARAVMIFVPVHLGLDRFNVEYASSLLRVMRLPQSLGFIGGSPNHSLYFVGSHGQKLFYLDPHTTYNTFDIRRATTAELKTYHCSRLRVMSINHLDPSLAFGFLCRNASDLLRLTNSLKDINSASKSFPIISVAKKRCEPTSLKVSTISLEEDTDRDIGGVAAPPNEKNCSSGGDWTLL